MPGSGAVREAACRRSRNESGTRPASSEKKCCGRRRAAAAKAARLSERMRVFRTRRVDRRGAVRGRSPVPVRLCGTARIEPSAVNPLNFSVVAGNSRDERGVAAPAAGVGAIWEGVMEPQGGETATADAARLEIELGVRTFYGLAMVPEVVLAACTALHGRVPAATQVGVGIASGLPTFPGAGAGLAASGANGFASVSQPGGKGTVQSGASTWSRNRGRSWLVAHTFGRLPGQAPWYNLPTSIQGCSE